MSLSSLLPAPNYAQQFEDDLEDEEEVHSSKMKLATTGPPPYMHRQGWVPRSQADFGDGGAFPEIMVAQFPLGMGFEKKEKSNALPVQMDENGHIKFDDLLRQGTRKDKVIHSKFTDLVEKQIKADDDDPELARPDEEKMKEVAEKTRMALEKTVNEKIAAAQPTQAAKKQGESQYIRYTPSQGGVMFNSGAKQRVIRMVESQRDPMEPPRFKTNKKIPRGPPSPPAPVMHSPTRKTTVKEQLEWKIPPCISNWKNPKGYTIPLDKRLAADGRGLQDPHINDKFAKLAESLYIADRKAREAVETRASLEMKLAQRDKEKQEARLSNLAEEARKKRSGLASAPTSKDEASRNEIRIERRRDREREKKMSRASSDKKSKKNRDGERDVSEKIALGLPNAGASSETMYDARLFDGEGGMGSGFGEEDAYNVYSQPWRKDTSSIYRPSKNIDSDLHGDDLESLIKTKRFEPDKGFSGMDGSSSRSGPVQFEKEEDFFQVDKLFEDAKLGGKRSDKHSKEYEGSSKRPKH